MKKQILDAPFEDSFDDLLEQGEKIIWEGTPSSHQLFLLGQPLHKDGGYDKHFLWAITILGTIFCFLFAKFLITGFLFLFLMLSAIWLYPWWKNQFRQGTRYAITPKRILFQFKKRWRSKPEFHVIPFEELKNLIVNLKYDIDRLRKDYEETEMEFPEAMYTDQMKKLGTIFLVPHHPELIPFETKDLESNARRHQPTLELVDDVEEVAKLIREGIQNAR